MSSALTLRTLFERAEVGRGSASEIMVDFTKPGIFNPERLKQQREQLGLSVQECAGKAGLKVQRYEQFEAGHDAPDETELHHLAQALDCADSYLINISATPKQNFTEREKRFHERMVRDPDFRQRMQRAMVASDLLRQQATSNLLFRLILPIRVRVAWATLIDQRFFFKALAVAYNIGLVITSVIILLMLHLSLESSVLVGIGLLILSPILAPLLSYFTCKLAVPARLRKED